MKPLLIEVYALDFKYKTISNAVIPQAILQDVQSIQKKLQSKQLPTSVKSIVALLLTEKAEIQKAFL